METDLKIKPSETASDKYLITNNCVERLLEEWDKYGKLIVAYDFDNTVYESNGDCSQVIELLRACKDLGCYMIVFTCRPAEEYHIVEEFLQSNDIPYDIINENCPDTNFKTSRKIFYNIFLDDRCGLRSAYETLVQTIDRRLHKDGDDIGVL